MQKKQHLISPIGMQKDVSVRLFPKDFAFDLKNIRITAEEDFNTLCLVNEKSNKIVLLKTLEEKDFTEDYGNIIGYYSFLDFSILFSTLGEGESKTDYILKIYKENDTYYCQCLYKGNLKFDIEHPIETLGIEETDKIKKVYWVDGINYTRIINVSKEGIENIKTNDDNQFDVLTQIPNHNIIVDIEKNYVGGYFGAGVIQYVFTYFNMYGQQSNIVYTSPLLYTSAYDRGLAADETITNSFSLKISKYSTNFQYLRIYRIFRSSLEALPSVEILPAVSLKDREDTIVIQDSGTSGSTVDPTELLYLGAKGFYANTIQQKDNTLFLGNIEVKNEYVDTDIKNIVKDCVNLEFVLEKSKTLEIIDNEGNGITDSRNMLNTQYYYDNQLSDSSKDITFFQKGETYRFGIQFITNRGTWSDVIFLKDLKNDLRVVAFNFIDGVAQRPLVKATIPLKYLPPSIQTNYIGARLVCVFPTDLNREVLGQGIVVPTLYNMSDRLDNSPYAQSSWVARPDYILNKSNYNKLFDSKNIDLNRFYSKGFPLEFRMCNEEGLIALPPAYNYNAEVQYSNLYSETPGDYYWGNNYTFRSDIQFAERSQLLDEGKYYNNFGVDRTIVTMHSPEFDSNYKEYNKLPSNGVKFRIVGYVPVKTTLSDINVTTEDLFTSTNSRMATSIISNPSNGKDPLQNFSLQSYPFWVDSVTVQDGQESSNLGDVEWYAEDYKDKTLIAAFPIYLWQRHGPLNNMGARGGKEKSVLKSKFISNFRINLPPRYLKEEVDMSISGASIFSSDIVAAQIIKTEWKHQPNITYYGNVSKPLGVKKLDHFPIYAGAKEVFDINNITGLSELSTGKRGSYCFNDNKNTPIGHYGEIEESTNLPSNTEANNMTHWDDSETFSVNILPIEYKSTPHAVFSFDQIGDNYIQLPKFNLRNFYIKPGDTGSNITAVKLVLEKSCIETPTEEDIIAPIIYAKNTLGLGVGTMTGYSDQNKDKNKNDTKETEVTLDIKLLSTGDELKSITFYIKDYKSGAEGINYYPLLYLKTEKEEYSTLFINGLSPDSNTVSNPDYGYLKKTYTINSESSGSSIKFYLNPILENLPPQKWFTYFLRIDVESDLGIRTFNFSTNTELGTAIDVDSNSTDYMKSFTDTLSLVRPSSERYIAKDGYNLIWEKDQSHCNIRWDEIMINNDNPQEYNIIVNDFSKDLEVRDFSLSNNPDMKTVTIYDSCYVLGELYRDINNKFGGTTEEALSLNNWTPCSNPVYFKDIEDTEDPQLVLLADRGDTYLQRYDHLKTYSYSENSVNNVVDIVSFMCETRLNLDGRYDKNRIEDSYLYMNPSNFNLYNKVYSQPDNFFKGYYERSDVFKSVKHPAFITWSKPKEFGEEIDSWTNLNLSTGLPLDLDKGPIHKIVKFNNDLFTVQDKGISKILYNPRIMIPTSDGTPIEISNNNKVEGKNYITEHCGSQNKWSIITTPTGFYFVDGINEDIFVCDGKSVLNITQKNRMSSWVKNKDFKEIWDAKKFNSVKTLYDSNTKDIYFTTSEDCLAYNEILGTFTSFYSYNNISWLIPVRNDCLQVKKENTKDSLWAIHGGDSYSIFFGEKQDYFISLIANPEFVNDKIFSTLEFRSNVTKDSDKSTAPFNTLETENEYQKAKSYNTNLKQKFRIWRWDIGRDSIHKRDRIRNPWVLLKMTGNSTEKVSIYDTLVSYYS